VAARVTHAAVRIPWLLGLIATRSIDEQVQGIDDLVALARSQIVKGIDAYSALQVLRAGPPDSPDAATLQRFNANQANLGYALLLLQFTDNPSAATAQQIDDAAWSTVPNVPVIFWSFRFMVGLGLFFIALFASAFYLATRHRFEQNPRFLKLAFWSLPLPWIAVELGWIVAEYGRQPWVVDGVLPTFLGVSRTSVGNVWFSLAGFVIFYSALAAVDAYLLVQTVRRGPDGLGHSP
jgi:cytochrome bd ubiquinol oxidase subunit I